MAGGRDTAFVGIAVFEGVDDRAVLARVFGEALAPRIEAALHPGRDQLLLDRAEQSDEQAIAAELDDRAM